MALPLDSPFNEFNAGRSEEFKGEMVHLYVQQALARYPGLAETAKFRSFAQAGLDNMIMTITAWCLSGRIPTRTEDETVRWPDGWWEMLKDSHAPAWLLRRWPVRYAEKVIVTNTHHYFVCPHVNVPAHGRDKTVHIQFMATGSPLAERMSHNEPHY